MTTDPETARTDARPDLLVRSTSWLEFTLAAALLAAVLMNFINVVARYVFGYTLIWADEAQVYLMIALAFFGSVVAAVRQQHLRMDVLNRYFPRSVQRMLDALEAVGAVLLCGFVCWISTGYALRMQQIGSISENSKIPLWIPHSMLALAFACLTLVSIVHLVKRRQPRQDERTALSAAATTSEVTP